MYDSLTRVQRALLPVEIDGDSMPLLSPQSRRGRFRSCRCRYAVRSTMARDLRRDVLGTFWTYLCAPLDRPSNTAPHGRTPASLARAGTASYQGRRRRALARIESRDCASTALLLRGFFESTRALLSLRQRVANTPRSPTFHIDRAGAPLIALVHAFAPSDRRQKIDTDCFRLFGRQRVRFLQLTSASIALRAAPSNRENRALWFLKARQRLRDRRLHRVGVDLFLAQDRTCFVSGCPPINLPRSRTTTRLASGESLEATLERRFHASRASFDRASSCIDLVHDVAIACASMPLPTSPDRFSESNRAWHRSSIVSCWFEPTRTPSRASRVPRAVLRGSLLSGATIAAEHCLTFAQRRQLERFSLAARLLQIGAQLVESRRGRATFARAPLLRPSTLSTKSAIVRSPAQ